MTADAARRPDPVAIEAIAREALDLAAKATPGPWYRFGPLTDEEAGCAGGADARVVAADDDGGSYDVFDAPSVATVDFAAHADTHYAALATGALALAARNRRLVEALLAIERWGPFPPSGRKWEDGKPMSYGTAFGSNGERDYMREIARVALLAEEGDRG